MYSEGGHRRVGRRHPEILPGLLSLLVGDDSHSGREVDHGIIVIPRDKKCEMRANSLLLITRTQTLGGRHCPLAHRKS